MIKIAIILGSTRPGRKGDKISLFSLILVCLILTYCNSPRPVTANPDNHTATSGTLGSAKMTNSLPEKSDTARPVHDTLPKRQ